MCFLCFFFPFEKLKIYAAIKRKSVVVMNNLFKTSSPLPPIKCHNLNSSNELRKLKTTSPLNDDEDDDDDPDESIENKENVNTAIMKIE